MALNFSASPLKSKKELKHRIRQSDLPTKPPTDRHSTNFTKEHKSLKVSQLWNYWFQVSLSLIWMKKNNDLKSKKRLSLILKYFKNV